MDFQMSHLHAKDLHFSSKSIFGYDPVGSNCQATKTIFNLIDPIPLYTLFKKIFVFNLDTFFH